LVAAAADQKLWRSSNGGESAGCLPLLFLISCLSDPLFVCFTFCWAAAAAGQASTGGAGARDVSAPGKTGTRSLAA
jgi:hypothetical protein